MSLSDSDIERVSVVEKPFKLFDGGGLFVYFSPTGRKWWRLKYRFAGKEKQLSIGEYPSISIKAARAIRAEAKDLLAQGINPVDRQRQQRAEREAAEVRYEQSARFALSDGGALSFRLGSRTLSLTPEETAELRVFLDATRNVGRKKQEVICP